MFYVDSVITFSIFSKLLWKSILLIHYKSKRFQSPRLNQLYICALLFGGYTRFIPLDKMVYIDNGYLPLGILPMSQLELTFVSIVQWAIVVVFLIVPLE